MASFDAIINPPDEPTLFSTLKSLLTGKGLPASYWGGGDPIPVMLEHGFTPLLSVGYSFAAHIARGGSLRLALLLAKADLATWEDDPMRTFLGWLATDNFSVTPRPPAFTVGTLRVISSASADRTLPAGARFRDPSSGLYYRLLDGPVTIAAGATDYVSIQAEAAGAEYNVAASQITELVSTVTGLAVSNEAEAPATSWITSYGGSRETPDSVVLRCLGNWGRLSRLQNLPADAYRALALDVGITGVAAVTKAQVWSHYKDNGVLTPGHAANSITLYLAGDAGPVTTDQANAVKAAMLPFAGLHDELYCRPSGTATYTPVGTAYVARQADIVPVTTEIALAFTRLQTELQIGQEVDTFKIRRAVASIGLVEDFDESLSDYVPAKNALVTLSPSAISVQVTP